MRRIPLIIPVTEFRQDAAAALEQVRRSDEPVVITQRGRPAAVMMSVESFEQAERERGELRKRLNAMARGGESEAPVSSAPEPPSLDEVLETIQASRSLLDQYGVRRLSVFGSVARGTPHPGSDIDLLVEFARPVSLFDLVGLQNELQALLGRPVDLVTEEGLRPSMRDRVVAEAVRAA